MSVCLSPVTVERWDESRTEREHLVLRIRLSRRVSLMSRPLGARQFSSTQRGAPWNSRYQKPSACNPECGLGDVIRARQSGARSFTDAFIKKRPAVGATDRYHEGNKDPLHRERKVPTTKGTQS